MIMSSDYARGRLPGAARDALPEPEHGERPAHPESNGTVGIPWVGLFGRPEALHPQDPPFL